MKKAIILTMMIAAFCLFGSAPLNARQVKRIAFGKGKNSAVVKGNTGNYGAIYLVRARAGQKLVLTLAPAQKAGIPGCSRRAAKPFCCARSGAELTSSGWKNRAITRFLSARAAENPSPSR